MPTSRTATDACQHGVDLEICSVYHSLIPHTHTTLNAHLNALLEEARPRLLRLAKLNGVAADMTEDVVQETCLMSPTRPTRMESLRRAVYRAWNEVTTGSAIRA